MEESMGMGDSGSWARAIVRISPCTFSAIGIAISIGVSVLGAAWGIFIMGSSLIGAAIKAPRITSKNLIRCDCGIFVMAFADCNPYVSTVDLHRSQACGIAGKRLSLTFMLGNGS